MNRSGSVTWLSPGPRWEMVIVSGSGTTRASPMIELALVVVGVVGVPFLSRVSMRTLVSSGVRLSPRSVCTSNPSSALRERQVADLAHEQAGLHLQVVLALLRDAGLEEVRRRQAAAGEGSGCSASTNGGTAVGLPSRMRASTRSSFELEERAGTQPGVASWKRQSQAWNSATRVVLGVRCRGRS